MISRLFMEIVLMLGTLILKTLVPRKRGCIEYSPPHFSYLSHVVLLVIVL